MEAVCGAGEWGCTVQALAAALHSLHLYCATISATLLFCCVPKKQYKGPNQWRYQNVRGVASLLLGGVWCCGAAASTLRASDTVQLVAAMMTPPAWLAAAALHLALWTRCSTPPILYLVIYWLLTAASSTSILHHHLSTSPSSTHIQIYIQSITILLALFIAAVDCLCFYDEVLKRHDNHRKSPAEQNNISYKHNNSHFYSKIMYFWLNSLLCKGYEEPLEYNYLGDIPDKERPIKDFEKFMSIYSKLDGDKLDIKHPSIWKCYMKKVWPNFYIAGLLKLCGDLIGVVPPLGLAIIIQYIAEPNQNYSSGAHVTIEEFCNNGYVMLVIVTLALVSQAILSQNSTHLVTVEGMRLKAALQAMVYNKCMRLAPWSSDTNIDEESPLLTVPEDLATTRTGLLTNLVSQDTYNIMSCVWICHYIWAIPLKVTVILYLLYRKLGISAIIGTLVAVLLITPLQFYLGKKLSDNSKEVSKCTDHRISKLSEILQGINVIKLYVWEDLFREKILQLREVELKLLNKDTMYWTLLTFTTQISTILITVLTFTIYYFLETRNGLTAVNVFAGLAFFNQLTVPLLILPVTVLMVVQAVVSTRRIRDFLELPEASNVDDNVEDQSKIDKFDDTFIDHTPEEEKSFWDNDEDNKQEEIEDDNFSDDDMSDPISRSEYMIRFRNAAFTWGMRNDNLLELDDLDIPTGKLIMVVGATGSGKSSFLSAVIGEMFIERGDVVHNGSVSTWYAGQPPWLLEGTVRDNIVMDNPWCQRRYARVLRAAGLRPDLQLLPDGDMTQLGSHGSPLSGGQRVRVCVARALYSPARLLALDEPLAALDAALARHVVARALVPAARAGRTVLLATNRLELMHYADLVIVMEESRVSGFSGCGAQCGVVSRWSRLAGEARAAAARAGAGPPGGSARERERLVRALTRARFRRCASDDTMLGINDATGSHLLAEVPSFVGGSWRRPGRYQRPALSRQFSSPPASINSSKWRRDVRRAVSADESNTTLKREASILRRLLGPRTNRTLTRRTPHPLRRLISSESDTRHDDTTLNNGTNDDNGVETTYNSLTSNGGDTASGIINEQSVASKQENDEIIISECELWWEYAKACGWWGAVYWVAAVLAQALAVGADCWLAKLTAQTLDNKEVEQVWWQVQLYGAWCVCSAACSWCAGCAAGAGGGGARRRLHERALHAALHAAAQHYRHTPPGHTLHRFAADVQVVDKKLPTAISRWGQLMLLCVAAMLVNAVMAPWSILALLPAVLCYFILQSIYLCNAREFQRAEGRSAASVVSLCTETCTGAATIRTGKLQSKMRAAFFQRLDNNHNTLLLLNAANRWLGLSLDLVGAVSVCVSLGVALTGGSAAAAGLAGIYSLLLPAYLAHLAKCRADLDQQLAALERLHSDTNIPQEDYREDCPIPSGWQRKGKLEFENVSVQLDAGSPDVLHNINLTIEPGEKFAICGRSGSGKSTLLLSCVGATNITNGRILLDGQDIRNVPLRTLRHRIVMMPQDSVLFSGTLRENLDPLGVHTDEEIWHSLRAVGLYDFVSAQPAGLECSVERSRGGWSVGRAARAGAARAALHASTCAVLALDEPAAALDAAHERALLAALAAVAPNTTILTVTHRVSSVRGYGRAAVVEAGRVAECGAVRALLASPASRLARMLHTAHTLH